MNSWALEAWLAVASTSPFHIGLVRQVLFQDKVLIQVLDLAEFTDLGSFGLRLPIILDLLCSWSFKADQLSRLIVDRLSSDVR